jgi:hypothetical protein
MKNSTPNKKDENLPVESKRALLRHGKLTKFHTQVYQRPEPFSRPTLPPGAKGSEAEFHLNQKERALAQANDNALQYQRIILLYSSLAIDMLEAAESLGQPVSPRFERSMKAWKAQLRAHAKFYRVLRENGFELPSTLQMMTTIMGDDDESE